MEASGGVESSWNHRWTVMKPVSERSWTDGGRGVGRRVQCLMLLDFHDINLAAVSSDSAVCR